MDRGHVRERTRAMVDGMDGTQPGDPRKAARAVLEVLDSADPPLRRPDTLGEAQPRHNLD
ncbi:hypothetical protein D0T12_27785 [Actinomadura spongiicola]|uniref:Uncharacterized protein n=1 Tax=Actinomadura spongiicola TaxID=2303421 RepID=A0A372G9J1_9ACTN|nr:hypothetical protein D0T12_27785 [Actinomadura spongiicola]